jgi:hypothetical protein
MHLQEPTAEQRRIAAALGISLEGDSQSVAAARLADAVWPALHPGTEVRPATDRQRAFAESLGVALDGGSFAVCSARIDEELFRRNQERLGELALQPGDRVIKAERFTIGGQIVENNREFVVSSIGRDLRVYFKGGNGYGAWPSQLTKQASEVLTD